MNKSSVTIMVIVLLFFNCEENAQDLDEESNGSTITEEPQFQHIAFRVTCENYDNGVVVGVKIFERESQQVVDSGTTDSEGNYCSDILDSQKWYKIQIYELPAYTCVSWVKDVSIYNNPGYWYPICTTVDLGISHRGGECEGWEETWGCW